MKTIKKFWKFKWIRKLLISTTLLLLFFSLFLAPLRTDCFLPKPATPHGPIYINGNAEIDAFFFGNTSDGLSWGTAYVLEDLEFDTDTDHRGIDIFHTDRYLIIKDCNFTGYSGNGIRFTNVTHVNVTNCFFEGSYSGIRTEDRFYLSSIQNCNFTNCDYGMSLPYVINSTLLGNRMYNNGKDGAYIVYAENSTISSNTIYDNDDYGFRIYSSLNTDVILNNVSFNQDGGMTLSHSDENNISDNVIQENGRWGVILIDSHNNTFRDNELDLDEFFLDQAYDNDIDATNLVNGLPVSLIESQTSIIQTGLTNIGQLILVDCNFCTISDSELISSSGVLLTESHNNTISNVNITSASYSGIYLSRSEDNEIEDCTLDDCNYGIYVRDSDDVNVSNNDIFSSVKDGIIIEISDFVRVIGNNASLNTEMGICLQGSDNNIVSENVLLQNQDGIYLGSSENNTISWNEAGYNKHSGIDLEDADDNDILYNNVSYNEYTGIDSYQMRDLRIIGNNISNNEYHGVHFSYTDNITIYNNTFSHNWRSGVFFLSAENCTVSMNEVHNNRNSGIEVYGYSNHVEIWDNLVYENNPSGYYEYGGVKIRSDSANTTIWMNNFINNSDSLESEAVDDGPENVWDNGTHGNYWSNYIEIYPDATKIGDFWDIEYDIYGSAANTDRYPLVNPLIDGNIVFTAFFTANETDILTADYVQFTELTTGGSTPYSYDWDFGDGSSHSTDANPDHQYNSEGEFEVTLTITDDDAKVGIYSSNITVTLDLFPVASFTASDTLILTYETIYFTDTSTSGNLPLHYEWDFDDGTGNSTLQNPDHDWENAGTYDVVLTVNDTDGDMSTFSMEVTIEEEMYPVASFDVNATTIMEGEWIEFTFTGEEGNAPATFEWDFGDGHNSEERNPVHQYTVAGWYTVQLTVEDRVYSMDMMSMDITVNAPEPDRPKIPGYPFEWTMLFSILIIGAIIWIQLKKKQITKKN